MERTFRALKGIGTVAIASFTFISLPLVNTSAEAAEIEPQLNFVISKALTDIDREIDMTPEDANYIHALREHYEHSS
jgi:hypothetical protein